MDLSDPSVLAQSGRSPRCTARLPPPPNPHPRNERRLGAKRPRRHRDPDSRLMGVGPDSGIVFPLTPTLQPALRRTASAATRLTRPDQGRGGAGAGEPRRSRAARRRSRRPRPVTYGGPGTGSGGGGQARPSSTSSTSTRCRRRRSGATSTTCRSRGRGSTPGVAPTPPPLPAGNGTRVSGLGVRGRRARACPPAVGPRGGALKVSGRPTPPRLGPAHSPHLSPKSTLKPGAAGVIPGWAGGEGVVMRGSHKLFMCRSHWQPSFLHWDLEMLCRPLTRTRGPPGSQAGGLPKGEGPQGVTHRGGTSEPSRNRPRSEDLRRVPATDAPGSPVRDMHSPSTNLLLHLRPRWEGRDTTLGCRARRGHQDLSSPDENPEGTKVLTTRWTTPETSETLDV